MYHIHHTLGVITQVLPQGEANRLYSILTEELGMVRVHAQGVRLAKSKLKSHLIPYAVKEFSLVRGKEIWRLTTVKESSRYPDIVTGENARRVCARILATLTRLVSGEERQPSLFKVVSSCMEYLCTPAAQDYLEEIEIITIIRVLYELGYIEKTSYVTGIIATADFTPELCLAARANRSTLTNDINSALKASQL